MFSGANQAVLSANPDPDWREVRRIVRFPDWVARLERYLGAQRGRAFRYGAFDCCLFVCGAVEAISGVDPGRDFRGKYLSRETGRARLWEAGGFSSVAKAHGLNSIAPGLALRGDVLQMKRFSLGVVALNGRDAIVMGEYGLIAVPSSTAIAAWRV